MKHFDYVDLLFYKEKLLPYYKEIEIEDHLYNCDKCLEEFLSIIDENEIKSVSSIIPKDFSENIIKKVSKEKPKTIEKSNSKKKPISFGYYVAVAVVTIALTRIGFFNNMVDIVPMVSLELEYSSYKERPNLVGEYSEKIVDNTSKFINNIENIEVKEIRRNKNDREK